MKTNWRLNQGEGIAGERERKRRRECEQGRGEA